MRTDLVPWGLGSAALHVVLVVLLGMCRLALPIEGDRAGGAAKEPEPEAPSSVVRLETPPAFAPPASVERALILPPTVELPFDLRGQLIECDITDASPPREVHQEVRPSRAWGSLRVTPPGGVPGEGAVLAALRWLSRHQSAEGSWSLPGPCKECRPKAGESEFEIGVTALALLAFTRAGYRADSTAFYDGTSFGEVVSRAQRALVTAQDPEGCIGPRGGKSMYNHAIATLALAESGDRVALRRAVDFILAAQNPGKAWRYTPKCGDNDTSVTSWTVLALLSAEPGRLPPAAVAGTLAWFDEVTDGIYGLAGYTSRGFRRGIPDRHEQFNWHLTTTALSAAARWPLQGTKSPPYVASSLDLLLRDKPRWDAFDIDFVYWHAGTLAFKAVDGGRGPRWDAWKEAVRLALVPHQQSKRGECRDGSWDPVDRWSTEGGRVYATAINALTLEMLR